jgi:thioesterase domain-containing protein
MAQQLLAQGETPNFLGVFMTYHPSVDTFADRIRLHFRQFRVMGAKAKIAYTAKNVADKTRSLIWRAAYKLLKDIAPNSSRLFRNVLEMNLNALRSYVPKTFPGQMTVFMSGKVPSGFLNDPRVRLKEYLYDMDAFDIDLQIVPGEADSMFQEPFVSVLAEHLRTSLDESNDAV